MMRLFDVQVLNAEKYKKRQVRQNERVLEVSSERGNIYDRKGRVLALTADSYSIYLENKDVKTSLNILKKVVSKIYFSPDEYKKVRKRILKKRSFVWLKRKANEFEKDKVINLGFKNVNIIKEKKRYYPNMRLACHLLGTVSVDNKGIEGIERQFNTKLKGKNGEILIRLDARRKIYEVHKVKNWQRGDDLTLTIDSVIQYIAQKELKRAVEENKAKRGTVIVLSPFTGEILAMASYPDYNPNNPRTLTRYRRKNLAIELNYEPGSTFKVVTASSVIDKKKLNLRRLIYCEEGRYSYKGEIFTDHTNFGYLTPKEIIAHSSNIGTIKMALFIKGKEFYREEKYFGFGEKTGIQLPGEASGILRAPSKWSGITQVSMAIGYGIMVTPLQMLLAVNSIATGGYYVLPTVVQKRDGRVRGYRVVSKRTARIVKSFLKAVVKMGTGKIASIDGFDVAGKTGTARKAIDGKYSQKKYFSSFVGFVPADKPVLSIIVVIDEPSADKYYGGEVAAPVFKNIAQQSLRYLKIYPDFLKKRKFIFAEHILKKGEKNEAS
jgi:cell division protein FtsI (penicillin-binding protein 3)